MNQWFKWFVAAKFDKCDQEKILRHIFLHVLKHEPAIIHDFIFENFDIWAREYVDTKNVGLMHEKSGDTDEIVAYLRERFAKELAKIP